MPLNTLLDTSTLIRIARAKSDTAPVPNYFRSLFPNAHFSTDEFIDTLKIGGSRKLAPLVRPQVQGKPVYAGGAKVTRVKPAYLKPKDAVTATSMMARSAALGEVTAAEAMDPNMRYLATVVNIARQQDRAIDLRIEWMAAESLKHGRLVLEDDGYPREELDFERDPTHTRILLGANRWGEAGVNSLKQIKDARTQMSMAEFGAPASRATMGPGAFEILAQDPEVLALLKVDYRNYNGGMSLDLGLGTGERIEYKGSLGRGMDVFVHTDYFQDPITGATRKFLGDYDVLLTSPAVDGVQAFGAIQDVSAGMKSVAKYPKMWDQQDPSVTFIMTQSSPLTYPVNPNATYFMTVR